jgi:hypothetical protein
MAVGSRFLLGLQSVTILHMSAQAHFMFNSLVALVALAVIQV